MSKSYKKWEQNITTKKERHGGRRQAMGPDWMGLDSLVVLPPASAPLCRIERTMLTETRRLGVRPS